MNSNHKIKNEKLDYIKLRMYIHSQHWELKVNPQKKKHDIYNSYI